MAVPPVPAPQVSCFNSVVDFFNSSVRMINLTNSTTVEDYLTVKDVDSTAMKVCKMALVILTGFITLPAFAMIYDGACAVANKILSCFKTTETKAIDPALLAAIKGANSGWELDDADATEIVNALNALPNSGTVAEQEAAVTALGYEAGASNALVAAYNGLVYEAEPVNAFMFSMAKEAIQNAGQDYEITDQHTVAIFNAIYNADDNAAAKEVVVAMGYSAADADAYIAAFDARVVVHDAVYDAIAAVAGEWHLLEEADYIAIFSALEALPVDVSLAKQLEALNALEYKDVDALAYAQAYNGTRFA